MAFPVTLNGRTYTLTDFEGTNYVDGLPDAFEDFVTHAGDIYNSTSTTSNSIGTGSKTFTVEANKPYQAGTPLRIADAAAPSTNFLDTVVTSYSGTTLVVNSIGFGGSGTKTSWTVNIGGAKTVDGTLGLSQGGTGATDAAGARTNIDVYSKSESESRYLNISGDTGDVSFDGDLTITGSDAGTRLMVKSTNAGAADGPIIDLDRDSSSPVTGDDIGQIYFSGQNDADEKIQYGIIEGFIQDPTDGAEHGMVNYTYMVNGSKVGGIQMRGDQGGTAGEVNVNNGGLDMNFRVESDGNPNMLFVDAGTNRVGVGTNSPAQKLHIQDTGASTVLQIETGTNLNSQIYFADPNGSSPGYISYAHASDKMLFGAGGEESFRINPEGGVEFRAYNNNSAVFTASVSGSVMTVTAVSTGTLVEGAYIFGPTSLTTGLHHDTKIVSFGTGTGGVGTYNLNKNHDAASRTFYQADQNKKDGNRITFYDSDGGVLGGQPIGTIEWKSSDTQSDEQIVAFIGSHVNDGTPDANIIFGTKQNSQDTGDAKEKMRLWYNGDLDLSAGGGGIIFSDAGGSGTSPSSNKLDEYEEGTFTPTIADSDTGGNTSTTGQGVYTKIGRLVVVNIDIGNVNKTPLTTTNAMYVQGLPFANNGSVRATSAFQANLLGNSKGAYAHLAENQSAFSFKQNNDSFNEGAQAILCSDIKDDQMDLFGITLVYHAAV